MSKLHKVTLDDQVFWARSGQLLLEAALGGGVDLPHDCRAGRCGACLTRVVDGITIGGSASQSGMVQACQARVLSDLTLSCEKLPPVDMVDGRLTRLVDVADDIAELTILPDRPIMHLPGQYFRVKFRGFPERPFSPTVPLDGRRTSRSFRLNIKRVRDGRVTPHLGTRIQPGHRVRILGPFGRCFLRPGQTERLVLVGGGTGFAPIWAIARAALLENRMRPIWLVGGVRNPGALYMLQALAFAHRFPNVTAVTAVEYPEDLGNLVRTGTPDHHLPPLTPADLVYAAGAPAMVERVAVRAATAGASFYSDPFDAGPRGDNVLLAKLGSWLRSAVSGQPI